jgi:hypothetical protein
MTDNVLGTSDDPRLPDTERPIWQKEPVRVVNGIFTTLMAINVILMLTDVYEEEAGAIITAVIAGLAAIINELFTRAAVVPLKPLQDLAGHLTGKPAIHPQDPSTT